MNSQTGRILFENTSFAGNKHVPFENLKDWHTKLVIHCGLLSYLKFLKAVKSTWKKCLRLYYFLLSIALLYLLIFCSSRGSTGVKRKLTVQIYFTPQLKCWNTVSGSMGRRDRKNYEIFFKNFLILRNLSRYSWLVYLRECCLPCICYWVCHIETVSIKQLLRTMRDTSFLPGF